MKTLPFIPYVVLRAFQILFSIIILGLSADIGSLAPNDTYIASAWWAMVVGLLSLIACIFLLVTFFTARGLCSPLVNLIVDAVFVVFYITALGAFASQFQLVLEAGSCTVNYYDYAAREYSSYTNTSCGVVKGDMALLVLNFVLFIPSLVIAAVVFHTERTGMADGPAAESVGPIQGAPQTHGNYPGQPAPPMSPPPMSPPPPQAGYAPQGYPPQGYPPQGYPPQGYPQGQQG